MYKSNSIKKFHSTKNAKFLILCNIRISYFNQIKSNFTIILLKHKLNSEFFIIAFKTKWCGFIFVMIYNDLISTVVLNLNCESNVCYSVFLFTFECYLGLTIPRGWHNWWGWFSCNNQRYFHLRMFSILPKDLLST